MASTGMWLTGVEGSLPAAGVTARLYFATDTSRIFLDIGAAWVRLNLIPRGTYAGGTTYYPLDLVTYNGSVWRALATVTGVTPVEGASWTLFVSKGDTGTTSGAAGGDLSGTYPNPQIATGVILDADVNASAAIAESKLALASDAAAGTASRRTLGTGATQAAVGSHSHAHSALTGIDTDTATTAIHHTLGTGANQAAAGNDSRFTHYSIRDWAFQGTLTTVTGVLRVPIHATGTIASVRAMVGTAPTGAAIIVDLLKNGTTMYTTTGNRPTIAVSTNAVSATLPDVTSLAAGDYLTVSILQIGSTVAGANLVVSVRYSY